MSGLNYDLSGPVAYQSARGVAGRSQRRAMHIHARGFHGLAELSARRTARRPVRLGRIARTIALGPAGLLLRRKKHSNTSGAHRGHPQKGLGDLTTDLAALYPRVRTNVRGPHLRVVVPTATRVPTPHRARANAPGQHPRRVLHARRVRHPHAGIHPVVKPMNAPDALSGSYDGLGVTYHERARVKSQRGQRLSPAERHQLSVDRRSRNRSAAQQRRIVTAQRRGSRFMPTPTPTLSDYDGDPGLGKIKISGAMKKFVKNVKGGAKVARGTIGFKKGLTPNQLKKAKVVRKIVVINAAAAALVAGAIATGGAGIPAALKAAKAAKLAGTVSKVAKAKSLFSSIKGKVKSVRRALGLPAITLRGKAKRAVEGAEERAETAVEQGQMTPEQAAQYVENATTAANAEQTQEDRSGTASGSRPSGDTGSAPAVDEVQTATVVGGPVKKGGAGMGIAIAGAAILAMLMLRKK